MGKRNQLKDCAWEGYDVHWELYTPTCMEQGWRGSETRDDGGMLTHMKQRVTIPRALRSVQLATVAASSKPSSEQSHASEISPQGCDGVKASRHHGWTIVDRVRFHSGGQRGGGQGVPFVAQLGGGGGGGSGVQPAVLFAEV
jgi:hypothetical protein